jgi:hypothetical protein
MIQVHLHRLLHHTVSLIFQAGGWILRMCAWFRSERIRRGLLFQYYVNSCKTGRTRTWFSLNIDLQEWWIRVSSYISYLMKMPTQSEGLLALVSCWLGVHLSASRTAYSHTLMSSALLVGRLGMCRELSHR